MLGARQTMTDDKEPRCWSVHCLGDVFHKQPACCRLSCSAPSLLHRFGLLFFAHHRCY
jgi:hypothetical protein